jgi:multicomponent Na+:H+ antiporter subunit B
MAALVFELPFLTHSFVKLHGVPVYGELELASAFVFDLGVYMVVVGGLLTAVSVVGEE